MSEVEIIVRGGVAEVSKNKEYIQVLLIDYDDVPELVIDHQFLKDKKDFVVVTGYKGVWEIIQTPCDVKSYILNYDELQDV